jgi:hypothetical protein
MIASSHRGLYSRAIAINYDHDLFAFFRAGQFYPGVSPLAGIVEQVHEHLVEIFSLSREGVRSGHINLDEHAAFGVQALKHAGNSFGRRGNRRACPRRRRGGHGSRAAR